MAYNAEFNFQLKKKKKKRLFCVLQYVGAQLYYFTYKFRNFKQMLVPLRYFEIIINY